MKDLEIMPLDQAEFQKAKDKLDKLIKGVCALADKSEEAMEECCRADEFDARDNFAELSGLLNQAKGILLQARAVGGRIEGGGINRSGGT